MVNEWEKRKQAGGRSILTISCDWHGIFCSRARRCGGNFSCSIGRCWLTSFRIRIRFSGISFFCFHPRISRKRISTRLHPEPGRLFIVGDPKQSIYRFRNADIETYLEIADPQRLNSLGLDHLKLTTNFRSVPSILSFVDAAFTDVMKPADDDSRYQPRLPGLWRSRGSKDGVACAGGQPPWRCKERRRFKAHVAEIDRTGSRNGLPGSSAKFRARNPGRFRIRRKEAVAAGALLNMAISRSCFRS